jgi:hypothetical protein
MKGLGLRVEFISGFQHLYAKRLPLHVFPAQAMNRGAGFGRFPHFDESVSLFFPDRGSEDFAKLREHRLQAGIVGLDGEVSHIDLHDRQFLLSP